MMRNLYGIYMVTVIAPMRSSPSAKGIFFHVTTQAVYLKISYVMGGISRFSRSFFKVYTSHHNTGDTLHSLAFCTYRPRS